MISSAQFHSYRLSAEYFNLIAVLEAIISINYVCSIPSARTINTIKTHLLEVIIYVWYSHWVLLVTVCRSPNPQNRSLFRNYYYRGSQLLLHQPRTRWWWLAHNPMVAWITSSQPLRPEQFETEGGGARTNTNKMVAARVGKVLLVWLAE